MKLDVVFVCQHGELELQRVNDLAMKRAGLWDYFATLANTYAEQVHMTSMKGPSPIFCCGHSGSRKHSCSSK